MVRVASGATLNGGVALVIEFVSVFNERDETTRRRERPARRLIDFDPGFM
jgi:hypothetical protein